jgi:hypothetical protein
VEHGIWLMAVSRLLPWFLHQLSDAVVVRQCSWAFRFSSRLVQCLAVAVRLRCLLLVWLVGRVSGVVFGVGERLFAAWFLCCLGDETVVFMWHCSMYSSASLFGVLSLFLFGWFLRGFCSSLLLVATDFPLYVFFFHPSLLVHLARACWLIIFC